MWASDREVWNTWYVGASATKGSGSGESTPTFPGVAGVRGGLENTLGQSTTFGVIRYWSDLLDQGSSPGGHWMYVLEGKSGDVFWRAAEDFRPLADTLGLWPQSDIGLTGDIMVGRSLGDGQFCAVGTAVFTGWYKLDVPREVLPDPYPGHSGHTKWPQQDRDLQANKCELFVISGGKAFFTRFGVSAPLWGNILMQAHDKILKCGGLVFPQEPGEINATTTLFQGAIHQ